MKKQFELLAQYNQWMNANLIKQLSELDNNMLYEDRGAFFGSAFHTFSHLFTCDLLWLSRFIGVNSQTNLEHCLSHYPVPNSINEHFFDSLDNLQHHRTQLDADIIDWVGSIEAESFDKSLVYQNSVGNEFVEPFASVLLHFFNHQTHHRGQITTLISQSGNNDYCTDLLAIIRR